MHNSISPKVRSFLFASIFGAKGLVCHDGNLSLFCSFQVGAAILHGCRPFTFPSGGECEMLTAGVFGFGDFELDRNLYELRHNGHPLKLERIPLDLLFLLVERRGHLVAREEIHERIWGKGVFLDADSAINSAVRKLRRALGDDPESPRFVVTVPTRGYRFIAEVRESKPPPSANADTKSEGSRLLTDSPVRYVKNGDVHIAYRIFGDGPRDFVMIQGTLAHVEISWSSAAKQHLLERITKFARVIVFDKRGQGLSDRVVAEQTLEERIDDVRAVMDAAGSERATLYGWSEGGPMSLMFAATYPERVNALVLYGTFASTKDPPWSKDREEYYAMLREWELQWGEGILLRVNAPSVADDPAIKQWCGMMERASASPGSIVALMRANYEIDVRHILPTITIPTLIMHRTADALIPVVCGRYLAEHIPGARYLEIPGTDHTVTDVASEDFIADEIEKFLMSAVYNTEHHRVLTTVVVVQIDPANARSGDTQQTHRPIEDSRAIVNSEIGSFRGRRFDTSDAWFSATFDGPARAIRFASSVREKLQVLGLHTHIGIHTGECELIDDKATGTAVDIAVLVASRAGADEILLSNTVKDLVAGSNLEFEDRGARNLNGAGKWRLYRVKHQAESRV
jgi:pimeloyl-ACP methyl ester carboxylesterase/DNA-binding winged helix-turn-helix (wHTH) protein